MVLDWGKWIRDTREGLKTNPACSFFLRYGLLMLFLYMFVGFGFAFLAKALFFFYIAWTNIQRTKANGLRAILASAGWILFTAMAWLVMSLWLFLNKANVSMCGLLMLALQNK